MDGVTKPDCGRKAAGRIRRTFSGLAVDGVGLTHDATLAHDAKVPTITTAELLAES